MGQDILESGTPAGSGPVGRRQFLKIALGAGLVVMVEACAPSPPPTAQPTSAPAAPGAAAAKPTAAPGAAPPAAAKPTGALTVAIPNIGNPAYLPTRFDQNAMIIGNATFGESLLSRNQDMTLAPMLAEKWSLSPDGKVLTFDLRKGIKFHDGSDFTSADVKFTIEGVMHKDSINTDAALWRNAVDHIEAPTPQRAVIYLKEPNIAIPYRAAHPRYQTQVMLSKSYIEKSGESVAAQKPVGTGPWKFVEFKPGELVRFEAVENHWRKTPVFKELIIRQVPEESTRVAMVLRGEADLVQVSVSSAKRLKDGGASLFTDPSSHSIFMSLQGQYLPTREHFDPKVPWAADPADKAAWERARKVREAMNIAVDRKTIVETTLAGLGTPAKYFYVVPGSAFDDPSWKEIPYDPVRAKQLLAEAGYPNGFEFRVMLIEVGGRPGVPQVGEAVAQYWQAIGLRPKLERADYSATVRAPLLARNLAGIAYSYSFMSMDEPVVGHLGGWYSKADGTHGGEYAPLDDLIAKAAATTDYGERRAIQLQIGKMTMDEFITVPVAWVDGLWGGSKRVKEFPRTKGVPGVYNFEYVVPNS